MNVIEITQNIFYENFIMSESHDVKFFLFFFRNLIHSTAV